MNLTGDGTWTFGYDTENHLLSATKFGISASYLYPIHRQAPKTVGSVKTRFIYAGAEDGLYYYRARYYAQVLGRFLHTDSIGYADGSKLYL